MRRIVLFVTVMALVGVVSVPAGAAPVEKTTYTVAECADPDNPQAVAEFEYLADMSRVRVRGAVNLYHEFVLEAGSWTLIGTNTTVANGNAAFPSFEGPFWGTFDFEDDGTIGDFEGTWSWGMSEFGHASGRSDDGRLLKVTLGLAGDGLPEIPYPDPDACGITEFTVISH